MLMSLTPGTRLGAYEIIGPLGEGGMGEVYRARDTRLDRTVAIKILAGALAADAESRQRFEQEARAIAALNDPHICTIHDIGRHGDQDYIVLEHLDGESLALRLKKTPVLPLEEALAIAVQIGDALDRAHRAGIAHRDLKPGNVMLVQRAGASAPDVKLLDFGLAARTATARPSGLDASLAATMAPSLVATRPPSATVSSGFSGTVQYMSPEQLDGNEGDHRVDIFAFGCVLYEMLAGRKAFEGATAMTAIAAIMSTEPPPIASLQSMPHIDHLLRRCLEKDRDRRWQSIGDVTGELRWAIEHPTPSASPVAAKAPRSRLWALAAIGALVLAFVVAGMTYRVARRMTRPNDMPSFRLELTTPPTDDPTMSLTLDGRQIAFVANQNRVPMLWVRALDGLENRALPGTANASFPFWSPDGRSVGFFADGKLKRIDVDGGRPIVVADAANGRGGAWNSDGVILFSPGVSNPIMRVSIRGGAAERATEPNTGGSGPDHRWPQFLPDGNRFLFSSTLGAQQTRGIFIGSLDKTPLVRVVGSENAGRFAAPDKLLITRQATLEAYTFNPDSGVISGEPTVVGQGAIVGGAGGAVAASATGVLAYRTGGAQRRQLVWVDRKGSVLRAIGEPDTGNNGSPELSPDEQSVVVFSGRSGDNDIWIIEVARGLARRITDGPPADAHPTWDPDGQHVIFNTGRFPGHGTQGRQSITGAPAEPLFATGDPRGVVLSWTRDRKYALLRRENPKTSADLIAIAMSDQREVVVSQSPYDELEGQFSPDGKWVAFVSNDSGRPEVFVQSFPEARGRTQISTGGGTQVRWSADGKEIFYLAPDGKLMAASVALGGATPDVKLPVALFQAYLATGTNVVGNKPQYAVARDGRFLLNTAVESPSAPIVVAFNWMKKIK
jgi:Tol biopolymer transport system component/tRNA A-37 threonylcarbamoyl transferase component Bud32